METSSIEKKEVWEYLSSEIGYMALLRNLKGMEDAGISWDIKSKIASHISDKDEVARSRQLPFRFLSAYRELENRGYYQYLPALEKALDYSLTNVPKLKGNTLIVIDNSYSMSCVAGYGSTTLKDTANLFGVALAKRAEKSDVVAYATHHTTVNINKRSSTFKIVKEITITGGTNTYHALKENYNGHDRVILLTDEQYDSDYLRFRSLSPYDMIPSNVPVYTFNLAGYRSASSNSEPNRYQLGGLTDHSFSTIPLVEAGVSQSWPWES